MDDSNRNYSCIVRNYEKLLTNYNTLFAKNNYLKVENQSLKDLNEKNLTKIQQMKTSFFNIIKKYEVNERNHLREMELFKNELSSYNVCQEIAPVVPETTLQKRENIVENNMADMFNSLEDVCLGLINCAKRINIIDNDMSEEKHVLSSQNVCQDIALVVPETSLQKRINTADNNMPVEINASICKNGSHEIAPVVPETSSQKRINTIGIEITEFEQLQHKHIFNNSEITKFAKNCNELKTEIVTYEKGKLFSLIFHLIDQLNEKDEIIDNIVGEAENIKCNLVDAEKKSIEKDNMIKKITLEIGQLRKENENVRVEIGELSNSTRIQVENLQARLAVDIYEYVVLINSLKREKNETMNSYKELKNEFSRIKDEYDLVKLQVENRNETIVFNDSFINKLNMNNSSLESRLIKQDELLKNIDILHDLEIYKHQDTIFNLESKIKKYKELNNTLQIKCEKLQYDNKELNVKYAEQNNQTENYVKIKNDFNIMKMKNVQVSREKDSKIAEITGIVSKHVIELCECVKQKNYSQSELAILTKSHGKLSTDFNELNDKHQKLKTQFDEQTETIKSNNEMEKLWISKLDSVKEVLGAEVNTLKQRVLQLTEELSHSKAMKTPAKSVVGLAKCNSNLKPLKKVKKVIFTSNEPIAIRGRKPVMKLEPDKEIANTEIENNPVGNDAEKNILQAEENSIIDTVEKEKEKSEENPNNLIKERKQNSYPSKTPIRPKNKPDKEIMTNPSMVRNQIKYNTQCYSKKPQPAIKKPFR